MYLYGASGHAKVIIDIIKAQGGVVEGLVDDNPNLKELNGTPVLHDATGLSPFIISIGNCKIRKISQNDLIVRLLRSFILLQSFRLLLSSERVRW